MLTEAKNGNAFPNGSLEVSNPSFQLFILQIPWVQSLCWEDPLENRKATHSSILAWRIP